MLRFALPKSIEAKKVRERLDILAKRIQSTESDLKSIKESQQFRQWERFCKSWDSTPGTNTLEITEEKHALLAVSKIETQINQCNQLIENLNKLEKKQKAMEQSFFYNDPYLSMDEKKLVELITSTENFIGWIMGPYHIARPAKFTGTPVEPVLSNDTTIRAISY